MPESTVFHWTDRLEGKNPDYCPCSMGWPLAKQSGEVLICRGIFDSRHRRKILGLPVNPLIGEFYHYSEDPHEFYSNVRSEALARLIMTLRILRFHNAVDDD